jgi:hypothetical protein
MGEERGAGAGALELRGPTVALLDESLAVLVRGLGGNLDGLVWRARIRDDDSRVWRAVASRAQELPGAWAPAKSGAGAVAALQSLRPVSLDVRVEAPDGRGAARTFTRRLLGDGVRVRRWREGVAATLYLPAISGDGARSAPGATVGSGPAAAGVPGATVGSGPAAAGVPGATADSGPTAAVVLDATAGGNATVAVTLASALLASRGVLALAVSPPRAGGEADRETLLATAVELLTRMPAATAAPGGVQRLTDPLPVPPGVPAQGGDDLAARAATWDELLAQLGARPRLVA